MLAVFTLLSFVLTSATGASADQPRTEWKVTHKVLSGRYYTDSNVTLKVSTTSIELFDKKVQVLTIPVNKIVGITVDDRINRPMKDWGAAGTDIILAGPRIGADMGGCDATMLCAAGYAALAIASFGTWLVGLAVTAPLKNTEHYVGILWTDEHDVMQQALFKVRKGEHESLVAALQSASGKTPLDLIARRERLRDEITDASENATPLTLERQVLVNGRILKKGDYTLIVLPRGEDKAELAIFAGKKVDLRRLAGQALARVERTPTAAANATSSVATAHYTSGDTRAEIAEIVTRDSILKLDPTLIDAADAASPTRLTMNSGAAVTGTEVPVLNLQFEDGSVRVALVTFDGQPALRFPVMHEHIGSLKKLWETPTVCRGYLYVMADTIAFDPALNMTKSRDPFQVKRADLQSVKVINGNWLNGPGGVLLVWQKHRYEFWPDVEGVKLRTEGKDVEAMAAQRGHLAKQLKPVVALLDNAINDFGPTLRRYQSGKN